MSVSSIEEEINKTIKIKGVDIHNGAYLHFYETLLASYDPKLREARGVYYTTIHVVKFIVDAIDSVLFTYFVQSKGLSSAVDNKHITLLDFATGTGTFLLEVFRKAMQNIDKDRARYIIQKP